MMDINPEILKRALETEISQTDFLERPEAIFSIENIPMLTRGELSLVTGKAKSKKTFLMTLFAQGILNNGYKLLWIDTEQGEFYAQQATVRILQLCNLPFSDRLFPHAFRPASVPDRIEYLKALIDHRRPDCVILDGVRDITFDINQSKEATEIATLLLGLTSEYRCHIVNILHENKNDRNARGHLGAELVNKAETVLSITSDKESGVSTVECEYSRGLPIQPFGITIIDGLPVYTSPTVAPVKAPANKKEIPETLQEKVFTEVFSNVENGLQYITLQKELYKVFNTYGHSVGTNRIKEMIRISELNGLIEKNSNNGGYPRYFPKLG